MQASRFWAGPQDQKKELLRQKGIQRKTTLGCIQGHLCDANLWFGGFPYPVNPGRPEWSKVQTRGKPLVATAQAKYMSAGEQ